MTHRGHHLGMPASGKREVTGMTIARIRGEQIIEGWNTPVAAVWAQYA
jgi:hypothetical protein